MPEPARELPDLLRPRTRKPPLWLRVVYVVGALACFVLGVLGWLVPVVTGIPFYVAGLVLLGLASERARGWINRSERQLPNAWRVGLRRALLLIPSQRIRRLIRTADEDA
jgi:hypothetical protein